MGSLGLNIPPVLIKFCLEALERTLKSKTRPSAAPEPTSMPVPQLGGCPVRPGGAHVHQGNLRILAPQTHWPWGAVLPPARPLSPILMALTFACPQLLHTGCN